MRAGRRDRSTIRVAVVGYGNWAANHLRVLSQIPATVPVVVDPDPDRLLQARRAMPGVATAHELDDVVDRIDAAIIVTPPRSHVPLAMACVERGVHVLVEKPLGVNVAECERLVAAAERAGVTLMVGHTFEHNPAVWKLRDIIRSGQIGNVRYIDTARLNLGLYQHDVNVLWDLAPHDISIVNLLLGRRPSSVEARGQSHVGGPHEDVAHMRLDYDDPSLTAYIHVSWLDPCKVRRVTVVGDEKMVVFNDSGPEPIRLFDAGVRSSLDTNGTVRSAVDYRRGGVVSPHVVMQEPLLVEDQHFIECVRTGTTPSSDGRSGLEVVRILEAADRSMCSRPFALQPGAATVPPDVPASVGSRS